MKKTTLFERKIKEYNDHCILALHFYAEKDFDHSSIDFRKSGEAYMKILILKIYGETNGHKIITGEIDKQLKPMPTPAHPLIYNGLYQIICTHSTMKPDELSRLKDIQNRSNPSAHDRNAPIDETAAKENTELCRVQSYQLSLLLYTKLNQKMPSQLKWAYEGKINPAHIAELKASSWEELFEYADAFSPQTKYVLVAPPEFKNCTSSQLEIIGRINWSFIIDFNSSSKTDGLYKALQPNLENRCTPITLKQKGQKGIIGSGSYGNINWLFAAGLTSMPDTLCTTIKEWRKLKYQYLIKDLLTEFSSRSLNQYIIVYLWDNTDYLEEIVRVISEIDEMPFEMTKHLFVVSQQEIVEKIEAFDKFGISFRSFKISVPEIIGELSASVNPNDTHSDAIFVPARTKTEEQTIIDIHSIYHKLLGNGISVVHQNIAQTFSLEENDIPPFYEGKVISWKELSIDIEVHRNKYNGFLDKIKGHLATSKKSIKYELLHRPGAGGTSLSRQLAYDLRKEFPVIIISHFNKIATSRELLLLIDHVNKPILAIVEASDIGVNDVDELIRICNSSKKTVIFVYVRRVLRRSKDTDLITYISDTMADIDEKEKFVNKTKLYAKNKNVVSSFAGLPITACEVIDFSLAIAEADYNKEKLKEYIRSYIMNDKMPESHVQFITYVSIIYYYSQKKVSEYLMRSLFKKNLSDDLKQIRQPEQFIRKILIQETAQDGQEYTEYWRPRFSKFAEIVLEVVLATKNKHWKECLSSYILELIKLIKANNEFLVDETRDLLKSIFLERNNEDLLGKEEQWQDKISNDQFSELLNDISDKQTQKSILVALAEAYPTEAHFWGHLARFVYENAEEENEFIESEKYIKLSFNNGGDSDFNLQHIGGMCKRRQLEFYKRNYAKESVASVISEKKIKDLTQEANEYFDKSRSINPHNIHAYIAQIQTIITVLDLGMEISGNTKKNIFITQPANSWYLKQYEMVCTLIEDAKNLIEQLETLGVNKKIRKSKDYLSTSEGKSYEVLGDFYNSLELLNRLIETSERAHRPQLRLMYINSTLLSKVKGNRRQINEAWQLLTDKEIANIEKKLTDNLLQDNQNIHTLRVWFRFIRYSSIDISIEEIIARLKIWYQNSENNYILHLEAGYYLYVLNACLAIKGGDSFSSLNTKEANKYISVCKALSQNNKYPFEWLSTGEGIDCLLNHKDRRDENMDQLQLVKGTIAKIINRQQGQISMPCGLNVFFVPSYDNFIQGKDETTEVSFYVGFRHDGLFALNVRRINNTENNANTLVETETAPLAMEEIDRVEKIEELQETESDFSSPQEISDKSPGIKIVDKIDLSRYETPKRRR